MAAVPAHLQCPLLLSPPGYKSELCSLCTGSIPKTAVLCCGMCREQQRDCIFLICLFDEAVSGCALSNRFFNADQVSCFN